MAWSTLGIFCHFGVGPTDVGRLAHAGTRWWDGYTTNVQSHSEDFLPSHFIHRRVMAVLISLWPLCPSIPWAVIRIDTFIRQYFESIMRNGTTYTPCPTIPGGPNKNLTVPSFRPNKDESFPPYRALGSALPRGCRGRGGCSDSRITIFSRISWSAL